MNFKAGVDPKDLSPQCWYALWVADDLHRDLVHRDVVCTSTGEGEHSKRSRHYNAGWKGYSQACDLRKWYLKDEQFFVEELSSLLGSDYVVVLEKTHIHVQWSPNA